MNDGISLGQLAISGNLKDLEFAGMVIGREQQVTLVINANVGRGRSFF